MDDDQEDLIRRASAQQEALLGRVEQLMKRLYAVKGTKPRKQVWLVTSALEVYKMQSNVLFNLVLLGNCPQSALIDMRDELNQQLITITEMAKPLLGLNPED